MANITKEEMLRIVNENISRLENKEYTLYFFILDTKGNPSKSLEYTYHTAYVLSERGHNVVMLHQEKDFIGVGEWLGEEYANLKHMNIETDNVEITPSDFIFIPEIFANVMLQTKKLPCKRVVLVQNYANITEFMPVSQTLDGLGIIDAITTSKFQSNKLREYFPMVRTQEVSPSIRGVFRNSDAPRKLIINIIAKDQSDANRIVKPFYWKNPIYRWVSFRDLRGLPNDAMAEALREAAITIWVDDKTDFGTTLLEAVRCGGLVLAKIPDTPIEWMMDGDNLTDSILWFNDLDSASDILASVVNSWINDKVPAEIYEKQSKFDNYFTEEVQVKEIIEVYEKNIIEKRLKDFKETKVDVENNVIKSKNE
jgi:hypothetical protein